jgi:hypothetical protein
MFFPFRVLPCRDPAAWLILPVLECLVLDPPLPGLSRESQLVRLSRLVRFSRSMREDEHA